MVQAHCRNESCQRTGPWNLRKPVSEYAGSGPSCPDCGTTRVEIEEDEQSQTPNNAGGQAPARRGGGAAPAPQQQGDVITDLFAIADDDVPTQRRAQAVEGVLGKAGSIISKFVQYQDQKQQAQAERAKQVEIEKADLPECGECGYQFAGEDIPLQATQIRCPECHSVYNLKDTGGN